MTPLILASTCVWTTFLVWLLLIIIYYFYYYLAVLPPTQMLFLSQASSDNSLSKFKTLLGNQASLENGGTRLAQSLGLQSIFVRRNRYWFKYLNKPFVKFKSD